MEYNLSTHKIINDNYINGSIKYHLKNKKVDMIVTSPPYKNVPIEEYCEFLHKFIDVSDKILNPNGGRMALNINDIQLSKESKFPMIPFLFNNLFFEMNYKYRGHHIWYYGERIENEHPFQKKVMLPREETNTISKKEFPEARTYDNIYIFQKGDMIKRDMPYEMSKEEFIEYNFGFWKIPPEENNIHPVQFPVDVPYRAIKLYTYSDALILDPFGGVGTTSLAAHIAGRSSISVEISKEYCKKAYTRLKNEGVNIIDF